MSDKEHKSSYSFFKKGGKKPQGSLKQCVC